MGGEAEMEKLWDSMQMTIAIQLQSNTIWERLERIWAALDTQPSTNTTSHIGRDKFKKVEEEVGQLIGRMRDAINANNRQAAQEGIQISDLISVDLSMMEGLDVKEVVTGFELDLLKVTMSINCIHAVYSKDEATECGYDDDDDDNDDDALSHIIRTFEGPTAPEPR
ncbi:hypothetical protein Landi51_04012 [Colletotrichum acutatum]